MMKIKYCLGILLFWFAVTACSDFLEESSQDEVRPSTVDELMQLMVGEGYPMRGVMDCFLDLLTDDAECLGSNGSPASLTATQNARPVFMWSKDMFEELAASVPGTQGINVWETYYRKIMGCNVVLGYVDRVTGNHAQRENLRGQALAMRSYYYFMLVNLFGQPYNMGDPEKNLGVPLKLQMEVTDEFFKRNTVAEVYRQVIADLQKADSLLERYNLEMPVYKMSHLATKAILSRVYLYMEKWDLAFEYADRVLELKPELTSLAGFGNLATDDKGHNNLGMQSPHGVYNPTSSKEIIWAYGSSSEFNLMPTGASELPAYRVSTDLMSLYDYKSSVYEESDLGDLRGRLYFKNDISLSMGWMMVATPISSGKAGFNDLYCYKGIRTAEMYLNRAEVNVRRYRETGAEDCRQKALADLNHLREYRYDTRTTPYMKVDKHTVADLWQFYEEERRRELCYENHRWFDLRRYGMPRLEHTYIEDAQSTPQVAVLEEKGNRYVLPIPQKVLEQNPLLEQNP